MKRVLLLGNFPHGDALASALSPAHVVNRSSASPEATVLTEAAGSDLVILDLKGGARSHHTLIERIRQHTPQLPLIVIDGAKRSLAAADLGDSVEVLPRPVSQGELVRAAQRAIRRHTLQCRANVLEEQEARTFPVDGIVGRAPAFQAAVEAAQRAAADRGPVLIIGESGTGRELLARLIHTRGTGAAEPFVPVRCELFADRDFRMQVLEGAPPPAPPPRAVLAGHGTLFFDEAGRLDEAAQGALLLALRRPRARQGASAPPRLRARVIASVAPPGNGAPEPLSADLRARLAVHVVHVPPLRERPEDIGPLARRYLALYRTHTGSATRRISAEALERMTQYAWPGNLRELRNVVERILVLHGDAPAVRPEHLPREFHAEGPAAPVLEGARSFEEAVNSFERRLIENALRESNGVQTRAADLLGTTRRILRYRMKKLNISGG